MRITGGIHVNEPIMKGRDYDVFPSFPICTRMPRMQERRVFPYQNTWTAAALNVRCT